MTIINFYLHRICGHSLVVSDGVENQLLLKKNTKKADLLKTKERVICMKLSTALVACYTKPYILCDSHTSSLWQS